MNSAAEVCGEVRYWSAWVWNIHLRLKWPTVLWPRLAQAGGNDCTRVAHFSLDVSFDIAPVPVMQVSFISSQAAVWAVLWKRRGFCAHANWQIQREEINAEWEGKAQRTETDVAVQSSEGSLCSLNYLQCVRLGMLCVFHPAFSIAIHWDTDYD